MRRRVCGSWEKAVMAPAEFSAETDTSMLRSSVSAQAMHARKNSRAADRGLTVLRRNREGRYIVD